MNEDSCTPRLSHWRESALTVAALQGGQPLDLGGMDCVRPKNDIDINTTFAGGRRARPGRRQAELVLSLAAWRGFCGVYVRGPG